MYTSANSNFPTAGENEPRNSSEIANVIEVLDLRERWMPSIIDNFQDVSSTLELLLGNVWGNRKFDPATLLTKGITTLEDLPDFSTKQLFAGLVSFLNNELSPVWFNNELLTGNQLIRDIRFDVFITNFIKLKKAFDDNGLFSASMKRRFVYLTRKERLIDAPYTVHTHFDLLLYLHYFGKGNIDILSLLLSASHDSAEEGSTFVLTSEGKRKIDIVTPDIFFHRLAEKSLGLQLQLGIQALTEPSFNELIQSPEISSVLLDSFIKPEGNILYKEALNRFKAEASSDPAKLEEDFVRDFLQYGVLGEQYENIIKILIELAENPYTSLGLNSGQLKRLASSIIKVEIVDRMSEFADLYYIYVKRKDRYSPEYIKMQLLLTGGRMINSYNHLTKAVAATKDLLPDIDIIDTLLQHYLPFLYYQIINVARLLKDEKGVGLTLDEVISFANGPYQIQQQLANTITKQHADKRISQILYCLFR